MSDRIFGGLGLLFAVFYIWQASLTPDSFLTDVVGPRTFPYMLGAGLAVCSLIVILRPDTSPTWPKGMQLLEILMAIAVMALYAWVLPETGFLIATTVATAYLTWRLGTGPLGSVVAGVLTAVVIYLAFKKILGLSLAAGPLDWLIDSWANPLGHAIEGLFQSAPPPDAADVPKGD